MRLVKLNNRGDTLVEVMIAVAILALILASSYAVTGQAARLGQAAKERTQAVAYAQQQAEIIESFAARDWTEFVSMIDAVDATAKSHFIPSTWEASEGALIINDVIPDQSSAANYEVYYEEEIIEESGGDVKQIRFNIHVTWSPINSPGLAADGTPFKEETTLAVRVSPSEIGDD